MQREHAGVPDVQQHGKLHPDRSITDLLRCIALSVPGRAGVDMYKSVRCEWLSVVSSLYASRR